MTAANDHDDFQYQVSLLVKSSHIDLDPITAVIGLRPTTAWRAGEPLKRPTETIRDYNYCCFKLNIDRRNSLEANVVKYILKLEHIKEICRSILDDSGSIVLAVTWYTGQGRGYQFSCSFMRKLADLGIELGVEVFERHSSED
jgi:hypothetical protein